MTSLSEASEIVAAEEARLRDRGVGLPPSNPDAVAHHLAVAEGPDMPDETLIAPKKLDGFTHESPIRAFTEFRVAGNVAIGKGFRPSLGHLHTYLDAMLSKEGWRFVQVILPDDASNDPTILFYRDDIYKALAKDVITPATAERVVGKHPSLAAPYGGDPTNPKHYAGRACADIGERLSANGYQVLKYVWRLGRKDDPCVEMGKAVWYLDSEIKMLDVLKKHAKIMIRPNLIGLDDPNAFLEERIADQPLFTQNVARMLWQGYGARRLQAIYQALDEHRFHLDCGRGLAL